MSASIPSSPRSRRPLDCQHTIEPTTLASLVAIAVSIVFALTNQVQHIALRHMDVRAGTIVNVATTFGLLLVMAPLYFDLAWLRNPAIGWFALAGLIVPGLSMTLHTWSIRLMEPAITAALSSTSPVFSILIAAIFLQEQGGWHLYAGTAIIIGGIAFIALRSRRQRANWPLWAIAIPLGAALSRGIAHNVVKLGLTELASPLTAALIGSAVSCVLLSTRQGITRHPMPRKRAGYGWFAACGALNAIGLAGLNLALSLGTVSRVAPLIATTPAFTLILGHYFFRNASIGWPSVLAMG
ncbi:MAG: DMT family transporter [Burkholderiaceae bacterium]